MRRTAGDNPLLAIEEMIVYNSRDWGEKTSDAWLYAVVCGWGDDDEDYWDDVAESHGWTADDVARLKRLHQRWVELAGEGQ